MTTFEAFFTSIEDSLIHYRQKKEKKRKRISTCSYLGFLSGSEICSLKRQECCFTGDMCKVDWRKPASAQKACCCNSGSKHIINRGGAKFNRAGGEEFREKSNRPGAKVCRGALMVLSSKPEGSPGARWVPVELRWPPPHNTHTSAVLPRPN